MIRREDETRFWNWITSENRRKRYLVAAVASRFALMWKEIMIRDNFKGNFKSPETRYDKMFIVQGVIM